MMQQRSHSEALKRRITGTFIAGQTVPASSTRHDGAPPPARPPSRARPHPGRHVRGGRFARGCAGGRSDPGLRSEARFSGADGRMPGVRDRSAEAGRGASTPAGKRDHLRHHRLLALSRSLPLDRGRGADGGDRAASGGHLLPSSRRSPAPGGVGGERGAGSRHSGRPRLRRASSRRRRRSSIGVPGAARSGHCSWRLRSLQSCSGPPAPALPSHRLADPLHSGSAPAASRSLRNRGRSAS